MSDELRLSANPKARLYRNFDESFIEGVVPLQSEGRTTYGDRPYYFRARNERWTIQLGEKAWPTSYIEWPFDRDDPEPIASGDVPEELDFATYEDVEKWVRDLLEQHLKGQ